MNVTMDAATTDDFHRVLADHPRFWGERDMRSLHLLAMVQEFGSTCLVARAGGEVVGYVFGFTTPAGTGYVHLVATRDDARGTGLGRRLYGAFAKAAQAQGATALKAITSPANTGSIAFHHSLDFASAPVPDYDGRGRTMVVFTRALPLAD